MRGRQARGVLAAVVILAAAGCGDDGGGGDGAGASEAAASLPGDPIRVSVMFGEGALGTPEVADGADAAVRAVNAAGGVEDPVSGEARPLELVGCGVDLASDPNGPVECARSAVDAGVIANVGKVSVGTDEVTTFADAGIPMVGTSPTGPEDFTNPAVFPFTGGTLTGVQGVAAALQDAGASTLSLIAPDLALSRTLADYITPVLEGGPDDLVSEVYMPVDPSADITSFIAQVVDDDPDGVIALTSSDAFGQTMQALRSAGYEGEIGTANSIATPEVIEQVGEPAEGLVLVSDYMAITDPDNPRIGQFVDEMSAHAGDAVLDQYSLNAWLSVHVLADVLGTLPEISPAALMEALDGYEVDLDGVAPPFRLGEPGTSLPAPRVPRATVQFQTVEDGETVAAGDGEFVDLDRLATGSGG